MWYDWKPKPEVEWDGFVKLCPVNEYRVIEPASLPRGILPQRLLAKTHSVLMACSGLQNQRVYVMLNLNRVDRDEIDQMPYGIAFDGGSALVSGVLIQHGNYPERTTDLPRNFYEHVAASGIYPLNGMPPNSGGPISELNVGSQQEAFRLLVEEVKVRFPEPPFVESGAYL